MTEPTRVAVVTGGASQSYVDEAVAWLAQNIPVRDDASREEMDRLRALMDRLSQGAQELLARTASRYALSIPCVSLSDGCEGNEGGVVGFGEGVKVFLGDDAAVAAGFFDGLEVGSAGEKPGGVGVAVGVA